MAETTWNSRPFQRAFDARTASGIDETAPRDSYWADMPYGGHTAYIEQQHMTRQRANKFGAPEISLTAGVWGETAGERLNRAARTKRMRDGFRLMVGQ